MLRWTGGSRARAETEAKRHHGTWIPPALVERVPPTDIGGQPPITDQVGVDGPSKTDLQNTMQQTDVGNSNECRDASSVSIEAEQAPTEAFPASVTDFPPRGAWTDQSSPLSVPPPDSEGLRGEASLPTAIHSDCSTDDTTAKAQLLLRWLATAARHTTRVYTFAAERCWAKQQQGSHSVGEGTSVDLATLRGLVARPRDDRTVPTEAALSEPPGTAKDLQPTRMKKRFEKTNADVVCRHELPNMTTVPHPSFDPQHPFSTAAPPLPLPITCNPRAPKKPTVAPMPIDDVVRSPQWVVTGGPWPVFPTPASVDGEGPATESSEAPTTLSFAAAPWPGTLPFFPALMEQEVMDGMHLLQFPTGWTFRADEVPSLPFPPNDVFYHDDYYAPPPPWDALLPLAEPTDDGGISEGWHYATTPTVSEHQIAPIDPLRSTITMGSSSTHAAVEVTPHVQARRARRRARMRNLNGSRHDCQTEITERSRHFRERYGRYA